MVYLLRVNYIRELCHCVCHTVGKEAMQCVVVSLLSINQYKIICLSQWKQKCVSLL